MRRQEQIRLEARHATLITRIRVFENWLEGRANYENFEEDNEYLVTLRKVQDYKVELAKIEEAHSKLNEQGILNRIKARL